MLTYCNTTFWHLLDTHTESPKDQDDVTSVWHVDRRVTGGLNAHRKQTRTKKGDGVRWSGDQQVNRTGCIGSTAPSSGQHVYNRQSEENQDWCVKL